MATQIITYEGGTETWLEFCRRVNLLDLTDRLSGNPIKLDVNYPFKRTKDMARSWEDVDVSIKIYGNKAYGAPADFFEGTFTYEDIAQQIDDYNQSHSTNASLDLTKRPALSLQNRFDITYDDETNIVRRISLWSGATTFNIPRSSYEWVNTEYIGLYLNIQVGEGSRGQFEMRNRNTQGFFNSPSPYSEDGHYDECYYDINIPIFTSDYYAEDYATNGWTTENQKYCINLEETKKELKDIEPKYYYYSMALFKDGVQEKYLHWDITTFDKVNAYKVENRVPYNINFNTTPAGSEYADGRKSTIRTITEDGVHHTYTNVDAERLIDLTEDMYSYIEYELYKDGHVWSTNVTTNLTLWRDKYDSDRNIKNQLDDSESLNSGKVLSTYKIRTGKDVEETVNNDVNTAGFTKTFRLSLRQLKELGKALWSSDNDVISAILSSTKLTNNPIDLVVSCFYFPINSRNYTIAGGFTSLQLGDYVVSSAGNCEVIDGSHIETLASSFIEPVFNNYLDTSNVNTTLYLPFVGIVPIDYISIIGTVLSIDVCIDAMNGSLKYIVKTNNKIIAEYGCNFGASIPVTGADVSGKQRELVKDGWNLIGSGSNAISSLSRGDIGGALETIPSIVNSIQDINTQPSQLYSGSSSSSTSCCDILYPMLIFDVQEAIIPNNLYSEYGYPSNRIATIGSSSGWTEVLDVKLVGNMLDSEKSEILQMLANGIII